MRWAAGKRKKAASRPPHSQSVECGGLDAAFFLCDRRPRSDADRTRPPNELWRNTAVPPRLIGGRVGAARQAARARAHRALAARSGVCAQRYRPGPPRQGGPTQSPWPPHELRRNSSGGPRLCEAHQGAANTDGPRGVAPAFRDEPDAPMGAVRVSRPDRPSAGGRLASTRPAGHTAGAAGGRARVRGRRAERRRAQFTCFRPQEALVFQRVPGISRRWKPSTGLLAPRSRKSRSARRASGSPPSTGHRPTRPVVLFRWPA